jgi:hypothetical protein
MVVSIYLAATDVNVQLDSYNICTGTSALMRMNVNKQEFVDRQLVLILLADTSVNAHLVHFMIHRLWHV